MGCLPSSAFPAASVSMRFSWLTLADLHHVQPITGRHLATTPPPSSATRAGIFAPQVGKVMAEFPSSKQEGYSIP